MFARVILPLAVEGVFTYRLPPTLAEKAQPGTRVLVPFGKKRVYTAMIRSLAVYLLTGLVKIRW